jgi:predicted DNA-binding protein (MmcQ/YjbR family)
MDLAAFKAYCEALPFVEKTYPFDLETLVYKVKGKMFALTALDADPLFLNLKCDPEDAKALRAQYPSIVPGYHMNKEQWNSVYLDGSVPDTLVRELIDHSYTLVAQNLRKVDREAVFLALDRLRKAD